MAYTVTVTDDAFPKNHEFGIRGLGVFVNGKPKQVDEEAERNFITETRTTLKDALGNAENITLDGTTEVKGGVVGVLGIDPSEISDTVDLDTMLEMEKTTSADPETGEELPKDEQVSLVLPPASSNN